MPFRLATLGQLLVSDSGTGRTLAIQRKALAVLAVLAAERRPVSRDRLLLLLWPDGGDAARGALKQTVYNLRKSLGDQDVIVGTTELALDGDRMGSDIDELEAANARGDWDRVVGLYTGPFLDGVNIRGVADFDHWIDARRTHYAGLFHHALESTAIAAAARGDHRAAIASWRRLAAEDPLSSRTVLNLVTALAGAGDQAAALAHGEVHMRMLRSELGVEPDTALVLALARIRAGVPPVPAAGRTDSREDVVRVPDAPDRNALDTGVASTLLGTVQPSARLRRRRVSTGWILVLLMVAALAVAAAAWRSHSSPRVIASIDLPARGAARVTLNPFLDRVYVDGGASFEHALTVIDGASLQVRTVPHGAGAVVDPITNWYWSGDYGDRFVVVRNGSTDATLGRVALPGCPHAFAISDGWIWVAQQCDDHISVIDSRSRRVVRHIPIATLSREEVGGAKGMGELVINPNTRIIYFWKDMMPHRLDPRTWAVRETPDFGGPVFAVNAATNVLYVRVFQGVRVVDGASERVVAEIRLPWTPWSVTVGFEGARVYVPTPKALVVLDGRSHAIQRTITFSGGFQPDGLAVDDVRGRAYVVGTESTGRRTLKVLALDP